MALDTFDNLKLEIIQWSHRNDLDLLIDTFIQLAETEMMANPIEPLNLRPLETLDTFTTNIVDRFVALPVSYNSMRKVRIIDATGVFYPVYYRTPEQLQVLNHPGSPDFFTITDQVEFNRVSDIAYTGEFQYFSDLIPLSATNQTNTVLTDNPKLYLYGALSFLFRHAVDEQQSAQYYNDFINAVKGANNNDRLGRYGPAMRMMVNGPTP